MNETVALRRLASRPVSDGDPAHHAAEDRFWAAVRALPARQAQAIALFYVEDRSVAEIARNPSTEAEPAVRVHLHRGRLALARTLGVDGQEEAP